MKVTIKKENYDEKVAMKLITLAQSKSLSNESKKFMISSYGILLANIISLHEDEFKGINNVCLDAIEEIKDNNNIQKFIAFSLSVVDLLSKDFNQVEISFDEKGNADIKKI